MTERNAPASDGHITVSEAIRLTGYCRQNIYVMLRERKVKSIKTKYGDIVLFLVDRASLLAYCKQRRRLVNEHA